MRLAVSGASGAVGSVVVPRLASAGHELVLVGRDPDRLREQYPSLACFAYSDLDDALQGCGALINLAVRNNDRRAPPQAYRDANVDLVQTLYRAAAMAGVPHFIQFSTLRAEQPHGRDAYGQSKREAEDWLSRQSRPAVDVVRLPAVRGARAGGGSTTLGRTLLPEGLVSALRPEVSRATIADAVVGLLGDLPAEPPVRITVLAEPMDANRWYRVLKRTMDLGFAIVVSLLLWWLMALLWLLVRVTSAGPGLFIQIRVGKDQRVFRCVKFRTMRVGTAQAASHEVSSAQVTAIGRFLRRFKLDELPQVVNLVRGEMTLVGPRPCLPSQRELIAERAVRGVFAAEPGITGWAQVRGMDMSDPVRLARADADYLKRRSILLDLKIVLKTLVGGGIGDRTAPQDQLKTIRS